MKWTRKISETPIFYPTEENSKLNDGLAKLDTLIDALDEKSPERNDGRKGKISDLVCDRTQWYLTCIEDIFATWEEDEEVPARFYASLCFWGGSALLEIDSLKTVLGAKETIINGYNPFTGTSFDNAVQPEQGD